MKLMIIVGARPNFMKAAPILRAISEHNSRIMDGADQIRRTLVHTGQHYDAAMSDAFFHDLDLPKPDIFLGVGSGTHAAQTAEIMKRFEEVLGNEHPDIVIVVGDVNSTLACSLVTAKLTPNGTGRRPMLAHVEAGLRSFDRSMPEECNRVVTDHLADLLFVTEASGIANLRNEGISEDKIFFVGNTMIDSLLASEPMAAKSKIVERLGFGPETNGNGRVAVTPYVLLTLHRPANVDERESFVEILEGLREVAALYPIVFPAHPRTQKQIHQHGLESYFDFSPGGHGGRPHHPGSKSTLVIEPQGYLDFLCLMKNASLVVTDSGGIQEETTCLGVPCVTVRENTERPVTIERGSNVLGGTRRDGIRGAIREQLGRKRERIKPEKWDGRAAQRIIDILAHQYQSSEQGTVPVVLTS